MSNLGKWNAAYRGQNSSTLLYGENGTYTKGAEFLKDCSVVEDWGCGLGVFGATIKGLNPKISVINIDGSAPDDSDTIIADLVRYKSRTEGIFMRHVLEHNLEWEAILKNAIESCTRKLCLVLFTPFADETWNIYQFTFADGRTCPVLSFSRGDINKFIEDSHLYVKLEDEIETNTEFGVEHIYYITKVEKPTLALNMVVYNEEKRLSELSRSGVFELFDEVVIADQESTDNTAEIIKSIPGAKYIKDKHSGYCESSRQIVHNNTRSTWVLVMDADETLTDEFASQIRELIDDKYYGYWCSFEHTVAGKPEESYHIEHGKYRLYRKDKVIHLGQIHTPPRPTENKNLGDLQFVCFNHFKTQEEWNSDHQRYIEMGYYDATTTDS